MTSLLVAAAISLLAIVVTLSTIGTREAAQPVVEPVFHTQKLTRDVQRYVAAARRHLLTGLAKDKTTAADRERDMRGTLDLLARSVGADAKQAVTDIQRVVEQIIASVSAATRDTNPSDGDRARADQVARLEHRLVTDYAAYHDRLDVLVQQVDRSLLELDESRTLAKRARWFAVALGALALALVVVSLRMLDRARERPPKVVATTVPPPRPDEAAVPPTPAGEPPEGEPRLLG